MNRALLNLELLHAFIRPAAPSPRPAVAHAIVCTNPAGQLRPDELHPGRQPPDILITSIKYAQSSVFNSLAELSAMHCNAAECNAMQLNAMHCNLN